MAIFPLAFFHVQSSTDLGTQCSNVHGKINPYSKYKPVIQPYLGIMTDALYKEANYGFRIPQGINLVDAFNAVKGGVEPSQWKSPSSTATKIKYGWYYQPPTGGNASPYRATDFDNYDHNAPRNIVSVSSSLINREFSQLTQSGDFIVSMDVYAPEDFSAFTNKYLGIAVRKSNGTNLKFKTSLGKIGSDSGSDVQFDKNELDAAFPTTSTVYDMIPFLTGSPTQNLDVNQSNFNVQVTDVILLPVTENYLTVTKIYKGATSNFRFDVTVTKTTRNQMTFNVVVTCISTTAQTLIKANIKYKTSAYNDDSFWEQEGLINLGLTGSAVLQPQQEYTVVTGKTVNYAAYQEISSPWYTEVHIYYPNSTGEDVFAGNGEGEYNP